MKEVSREGEQEEEKWGGGAAGHARNCFSLPAKRDGMKELLKKSELRIEMGGGAAPPNPPARGLCPPPPPA